MQVAEAEVKAAGRTFALRPHLRCLLPGRLRLHRMHGNAMLMQCCATLNDGAKAKKTLQLPTVRKQPWGKVGWPSGVLPGSVLANLPVTGRQIAIYLECVSCAYSSTDTLARQIIVRARTLSSDMICSPVIDSL